MNAVRNVLDPGSSLGRPLDRRGFLRLGGVAGAAVLLGGCGGTSTPPGAGSQSFGSGATYDGPKVPGVLERLHRRRRAVHAQARRPVQPAHKDISVKMTVMQWADYYQKLPNAVAAAAAPTSASCTSTRSPPTPPAR